MSGRSLISNPPKRMKLRVKRHEVIQPSDLSYRLIPLTQGQNAIVDTKDFAWLSQWNWHAQWNARTASFYAQRLSGLHGTCIAMHRLILGCKGKHQGDHRDHNTLNNRRRNLRKCSASQNQRNKRMNKNNSTGFRGVTKEHGKWRAGIKVNRRTIKLGTFPSPEAAARKFDEAARRYHGEFASTNF